MNFLTSSYEAKICSFRDIFVRNKFFKTLTRIKKITFQPLIRTLEIKQKHNEDGHYISYFRMSHFILCDDFI